MSGPLLSMVPLTQVMPRPTGHTHTAMAAMEAVLIDLGYTPQVEVGEWSIDAQLYRDRFWDRGGPIGIGPLRAFALRLHQPSPDRLWWLVEYPARGPDEWTMPHSASSTRRVTILGDATLPVHAQDLGVLDYLTERPEQR